MSGYIDGSDYHRTRSIIIIPYLLSTWGCGKCGVSKLAYSFLALGGRLEIKALAFISTTTGLQENLQAPKLKRMIRRASLVPIIFSQLVI